MKITKSKLKQIIREELSRMINQEGKGTGKKYTHPEHPGIIFTKGRDPKSGRPSYTGREEGGDPFVVVKVLSNPSEIAELEPMGHDDPGPQDEKFTHPDYPGVTFTKEYSSGGRPMARGKNKAGKYFSIFDSTKIAELKPV